MINGAIYSANLPERDKVVYLYLKERCGDKNQCFPAMKTIARDLCVCKKTVKRAVHELEKYGYIKTKQRWRENGGKSTQNVNLNTLICLSQNKNNTLWIIKYRE